MGEVHIVVMSLAHYVAYIQSRATPRIRVGSESAVGFEFPLYLY